MNFEDLELIIQNTLKQATSENIIGKEITPFLLARIAAETKGKSLKTSILEFWFEINSFITSKLT